MNYYTNPGWVVTPPYQPQSVTPIQNQPQMQNTFAWIQGEEAARNYPVAPGNTVVLIDSDKPVMYMKTTDLSGRPQQMQIRYLVSKEDFDKLQNGASFSQNTDEYVTKEYFERKMSELDSKFVARRRDK